MENPDILNFDEQVDLLDRLILLSRHRSIEWRHPTETNSPYPVRNDVRVAAVGDFVALISSVDGDGVAPFQLFVLTSSDDHHQLIADIRMQAADEGGSEDINNRMTELYQLATQRSMQARQAISNLFQELGKLEGPE
jgi:hypothetical protein